MLAPRSRSNATTLTEPSRAAMISGLPSPGTAIFHVGAAVQQVTHDVQSPLARRRNERTAVPVQHAVHVGARLEQLVNPGDVAAFCGFVQRAIQSSNAALSRVSTTRALLPRSARLRRRDCTDGRVR